MNIGLIFLFLSLIVVFNALYLFFSKNNTSGGFTDYLVSGLLCVACVMLLLLRGGV